MRNPLRLICWENTETISLPHGPVSAFMADRWRIGLRQMRVIIQEDFTMEKTIYDASNGLWYELRGDYYIPCLTVPAQEERAIGIWGQRHLRYIKTDRKALYPELLTSGRLNAYLADINEQATKQMLLLTKQMAECEGVTEQFKEQDQMLWVQRMNNILHRTMEFVNHELIYA